MAVAIVTKRFKPFKLGDNVELHQVGIPWHFGWRTTEEGQSNDPAVPKPEVYYDQIDPDLDGNATLWFRARAGSTKRVASAVGEGAMAEVYLAEQGSLKPALLPNSCTIRIAL